MGLFGRDASNGKTIRSLNVSYFSGIDKYIIDAAVHLTLQDDKLYIESRAYKLPPASIQYSQIVSAGISKGSYIVEKSDNVIGGAVAGGLLFGGIGAIIGGMAGAGGKKKLNGEFLVINYRPLGMDDVKVVSFQIVGASIGAKKFLEELCKKAEIEYVKNDASQEEIKL